MASVWPRRISVHGVSGTKSYLSSWCQCRLELSQFMVSVSPRAISINGVGGTKSYLSSWCQYRLELSQFMVSVSSRAISVQSVSVAKSYLNSWSQRRPDLSQPSRCHCYPKATQFMLMLLCSCGLTPISVLSVCDCRQGYSGG